MVEWGGPSFLNPSDPRFFVPTCSSHAEHSSRQSILCRGLVHNGFDALRYRQNAPPRLCPWLVTVFPPASSWSISTLARIWAVAPSRALKQAFLQPAGEDQGSRAEPGGTDSAHDPSLHYCFPLLPSKRPSLFSIPNNSGYAAAGMSANTFERAGVCGSTSCSSYGWTSFDTVCSGGGVLRRDDRFGVLVGGMATP